MTAASIQLTVTAKCLAAECGWKGDSYGAGDKHCRTTGHPVCTRMVPA